MGHLPLPAPSLQSALNDIVRVYTARSSLGPVLARLQDAPLDPAAAAGMREWLELAYPPAAEALQRMQSSPLIEVADSALQDPGPGERDGAPVAPAPTTHHPVRATISAAAVTPHVDYDEVTS